MLRGWCETAPGPQDGQDGSAVTMSQRITNRSSPDREIMPEDREKIITAASTGVYFMALY